MEYNYGTGEDCGRVNSVTFGNGQTITYEYDDYNNVIGISYDGGTTYSYTYTYSSTSGLSSVTDNLSHQITRYTDTGYEIYTIPQTGQGVLLYSSSYDDDDNFVQTVNGTTFTFADGAAETTAEAATRRTTGLSVNRSTISSTGTNLALSSSTDFFGRPVNKTLGVKDGENNLGSVVVDVTYQNGTGDRTTEFVSSYKNVVTPTTGTATTVEYTYTYDANGNILTDSLDSVLRNSYVYDEAGQLIRVNDVVQNKTFCYTYDNGGNLIYKKRYAYTTSDTLGPVLQTMATYAYTDDNWKDRLTSYKGIPLTYDTIGNLTYFDGASFTWSAGRQLKKYEISLVGFSIDYKYSADGLRTQKYIDDDRTYTQTTYGYIWADGKLISQTDGTDVLYFLYDSNDSSIGFVLNDAATYLYVKNLQGDITGIADENGAIIVNYTYDEWGKLLSTTGSAANTIGALNPLRYRGYYYDTETGYYYLQSRYYNPSWGRFINADVYCDTGKYSIGSNMFAYCENDAINYSDFNGTFSKDYHYDKTLMIATQYFKKRFAESMALGCKSVDEMYTALRITSKEYQGWHFNVNYNNKSLEDSRDVHTYEMIQKAYDVFFSVNKNSNPRSLISKLDGAFHYLGRGLHCQQDKISHNDDVSIHAFGLFWLHLPRKDDPNKPYLDSGYTTGEVNEVVTHVYMLLLYLKIKSNYPGLISIVFA